MGPFLWTGQTIHVLMHGLFLLVKDGKEENYVYLSLVEKFLPSQAK